MDPLMPRKPQDIDRWSDEAERDPTADPTTGPDDRWVNETARPDPDYPAAAGEGGTDALKATLEDGREPSDGPTDPLIHGQAR